jgi:DUF4097 and DUF4098 domain-containing protein YvlB
MRRLIAAAALLIAPSLFAHSQNVSITTDDSDDVTSCSQIKVSFDHATALRAEEELPVANVRSLKIVSDQRGGVRVAGWDQPRYAVTVCKAAAAADTLRSVSAKLSGNEVTATGPDSEQWIVYLLVRTPRNATLDVDTHNGPTSFHHVDGTLSVHAKNGPVSLKDSSGTIDVSAANGPISLAGGSGNVTITAKNGPLSVKLDGARWDGTLHAETVNGPVSLKLPKNFGSGVDLSVDGHGPISCKAEACREATRAWRNDEKAMPRKLSFGSGPRNVTLSTVNGPVVVKEGE